MKRLFLFASLLLVVCSCNNSHQAKVHVAIKDADTTDIVLQRLNYNRLQTVDTIKTDLNGEFTYKVTLKNDSPALYYLYHGDTKLASMILLPGDNVRIEADKAGNFEISGSEESVKLKEVETEFAKARAQMAQVLSTVTEDMTDADLKPVNAQLSRIYIDYKRALTKRMMTDPTSLTSAIAAFYKFNDELPVFNENTDAILFKSVYNELSKVYPKSEYLQALLEEATKRERNLEFNYRFDEFEEIGFPDITMPDVNGVEQSLQSLKGNAILLMFWSASMDDQRMLNQDLLDVYGKYHDQGFEIYQVALDIDKANWSRVVKAQKLPWISVNDGLGVDSPSLMMYNVQAIPAMFLISKDGDVFVKDITSVEMLEREVKKLL